MGQQCMEGGVHPRRQGAAHTHTATYQATRPPAPPAPAAVQRPVRAVVEGVAHDAAAQQGAGQALRQQQQTPR